MDARELQARARAAREDVGGSLEGDSPLDDIALELRALRAATYEVGASLARSLELLVRELELIRGVVGRQ